MKIGNFDILDSALEFSNVLSSGPGGQNVNKVSTAVMLRFDVVSDTSLPERIRGNLLRSHRSNSKGVVVIKSSRFRSAGRNKADALRRLEAILTEAAARRKKRVPTKPGRAARERRLAAKRRRSMLKANRKKGGFHE